MNDYREINPTMNNPSRSSISIRALISRFLRLVLAYSVAVAIFFSFFSAAQAKTKQTIIVGGDYNYPPYSFIDKNNVPKGFDVDLIKAVAKKIDVNLKFVFTPWAEALNNLKSGKIDLLLAVLYTEDRTRFFEFTIPYNTDYYSIFSGGKSGIHTVKDLQGKKVIMLKGDASIENFIKPLGLLKNITYAISYPEAFELLLSDQHDYILAPFAIASHTLKEMEEQEGKSLDIVSTGETLLPSLYRLAVKKGNTELLTNLNDGLDALKLEHEIEAIHQKWIEDRSTTWQSTEVIKYAMMGLIPIGLLVIFSLLWSWSLKKQVTKKSESLRAAVKKAEMANIAKSRFLANMNHEIRTPLNVISGFSQALMTDGEKRPLGEEVSKIAQNIHTAGDLLSDIIANILEISKIETEKVKVHLEEFNLKKIVQAVYGLNKVRALNQGVIFNYGYDAEIPEFIRSDRDKLQRILSILIGNAIKFTPNGKSIWLKLKKADGFFVLQLEDQGIGIAKEELSRIFEPFAQVDDSLSKKYGGTGLGLAIAKAYIEALHGTITLQDQKPQGSVFVVKLPLIRVETSENSR